MKGEAAFASPPVAIVTATILGLTLPDWTAIGGLCLLALQAAYLLWKWRREAKQPPKSSG